MSSKQYIVENVQSFMEREVMEKAVKILSAPDLHAIQVKKFNEHSPSLREVKGVFPTREDAIYAYNRVSVESGSQSWDCLLEEDGEIKGSIV